MAYNHSLWMHHRLTKGLNEKDGDRHFSSAWCDSGAFVPDSTRGDGFKLKRIDSD